MFERDLLRDADVGQFATIICAGPGGDAVERCVNSLDEPTGAVLLVGVAGGLSPRACAGDAYLITSVHAGGEDEPFRPIIQTLPSLETPQRVIRSVEQPVTSVEAKRQLHDRTGADLVDLESVAFARAATARGLRWGILRGISDGPQETMPAELIICVDAAGRTLRSRAIAITLRRPSLVPVMKRLRRNSIEAMERAAKMLRILGEAERAP